MNILGKRIKQLREENHLNQIELAKTLNISNTTLSTETTVKTSATTTNTKSGSPKTGDNGITAAFLTGIAAIGTALIIRNKKTL